MASERTEYRTCPLCEATCGLELTLRGDELRAVRGDDEDVFSAGFICPKGAGLKALHEDPDRVRTPLRRTAGGDFEPVGWDEAFAEIDRAPRDDPRPRRTQRRRRVSRQPERAQHERAAVLARPHPRARHAQRLLGVDGRPVPQADGGGAACSAAA